MSQSDVLIIETPSEGVRLLTLNRPDSLNSLTLDLQRQLDEAVDEASQDDDIRCVVVTGAGRAFCAGNDIHELVAMSPDTLMLTEVDREEWHWRFANCRKPLIVALNGLATGAGSILAASADIRVADQSATIKFASGKYGGVHCTWNLPPIVGLGRAKEYLYTAREIGSDEALQVGLFNKVVPDGKAKEAALDMASVIAKNSTAVQRIKESVQSNIGLEWELQYRRENRVLKSMIKGANGTVSAFQPFLRKEHHKTPAE